MDDALQQARLHLLEEREQFRDRLDVLKEHLGLSPRSVFVLDKDALDGFRATFDAVSRWCSDPDPDPKGLTRIIARLPGLDDVVIEGHSAAAAVTVNLTSDEMARAEEELSAAAVKVALQNKARDGRGAPASQQRDDAGPERQVRATLRRLLQIRLAYEIERRRAVLVVRGRDQAQERLLAPPREEESPEHRAEVFTELLKLQGQMAENQDRLVALWTEHQALRLDLFRDLGILPCDDWTSFYEQLTARPSGDHP
jgi:hypothetical protein